MNEERKPISLQDIFNAAWQAFIVENRPPAMDNAECCYLTQTGHKCAVGLCLPMGHPSQVVRNTFGAIVQLFPDLFDGRIQNMPRAELDLFQSALHDVLADTDTDEDGVDTVKWAICRSDRAIIYCVVAKAYNLTVPE